MSCAACGHDNRPGRKFCVECGAALALACAVCSAPYEAGEKFCGECGASLGAAAPRPDAGVEKETAGGPAGRTAVDAGARKVVTIVFADLVGSTALHERLDAESARRVMERYYEALRGAVDAHGGTVVKLLGDGVMAAFGLKRVAEDDALRAVRAAAAMQEAFRALVGVEAALGAAGLRVAVNTGEVVVSGARDDVIGDPVNVAARLQEQGGDGDVVLGEATRRLVATRVTLVPLGSVTLKGRAEAMAAYRLESLEPPAGAAAGPFVGRETELDRLEAVYDVVVATPATRLAVLLGSPGLGKSRLIDELGRRHADGATILAAHCDAAGGATFAPLAQVLRGFLDLDEAAAGDAVRAAVAEALAAGDEGERARIAGGIAGLLAGTATSPEETFFVVRRFFAGLAAARPVVLVIDDLHWAEPLLVDLVEHLVQWGGGVPLFVLVGARPELRDLRSSLVNPSGPVADVITLGGLDAGAAMRLAANVIGAADLPAAVAAKVLATSEGNPLFVGELVRMLVQEGALTKDGDRWIVGAGLASLEMPPTIHALLAARIERLGFEDRTVLERAAVVGRHFSRSAVAALLGRNGTELDTRLESLRRSELIERDTGWLLGEPVMRFHHVLIRDAAYRRLLKGTRAELHARLADWIEGQVGDAPEHDEMIGWHLEQAHQHLRELGPLDAAAVVLGERAARRLAAAGRRALARDDVSLAAGLLGRALQRLGADAPERADLVLDWCEALLAAGDVGPAVDAIAELDRVAADSARLRAWHTCFAGQLTVLTAPEDLHATAERVGAAARELAALEDAAGEAKAHFVHAQALARLGKIGACEAALDLALAAARRAGDRRRANAVLAGAPLAALWGPSPVTRASGRCLDVVRVLRITQGAPAVEAVALSCQGVLEALRGRTEAARRMLASARTMVEELGISHRLFETDVFAGRIDLLEGNAPAAERALRTGYEGLRDLGLGIDAARAAALLGRALLALDRPADAERLSHESELLAGDDLQAAIAWRGVRAEALARRGDHAAAITFAEAAVAIAAATDALLDHADARLALAAALRAGGRRAEADAEERRAFELWEAKGATVLAGRTQRPMPVEGPAAAAPTAAPAARSARRIRPNFASEHTRRVDLAVAARDVGALRDLWRDDAVNVDHVHGVSYGAAESTARFRSLIEEASARVWHEPLATLGPTLALCRVRTEAAETTVRDAAAGPSETSYVIVVEADECERGIHIDIYPADKLGAAVACLYERHALTLPEGPERERAAVAARAVAFILTSGGTPDLNLLYAPTYVDIDHRSVGYGTLQREDSGKLLGSWQELTDRIRLDIVDVLALDPNGLVRKTTTTGVWRDGGGAFERTVCTLTVFGPDGRVTAHETFDADREAEALARFDALTADAQPEEPVQRRVRPNAVTRVSAEFEAIVAARDFAALETFFAEDAECVDHPTGATYGAADMRTGMRRLMQSPDARLRCIPLATLGASWGLVRKEMSASGAVGGRFDVGAYEIVDVRVYGTDERGRLRHVEIFATERLGAALVRLYERYAESLPAGPASTRASAIARALAVFDGPIELDRIPNAYAPSFEAVDRRILGTWSARGREEMLTHWRGQLGLADDSGGRYDEVLALESGAILVHQRFWGSSRASGGVFEVVTLVLHVFDGDGLITHTELFEPEREADALARFAVLTAGAAPPPAARRRVRPNAATATVARFDAAIAVRDETALATLCAEALAVVDHPNGVAYGRDEVLVSFQRLLRMDDPTIHTETLATLGESLTLFRRRISASGGGRLDVGAYELDGVCLAEVDADGRFRRFETFAAERLRAALVRLFERYAESLPEGRARTRASGVAGALAAFDGVDADRIASGLAPSYVCVDHRTLGTWSAQGREEWLSHSRAQAELAADVALRDDDILALDPGTTALRTTFAGISRVSGGAFENVVITVSTHDAEGLIIRTEVFEPDQEAAALACFDALTVNATAQKPVPRRVSPNAATRNFAALETAFARRDLAAVDALLGDPLETIEHPTGTTYGRAGQLESTRWMMRLPDLVFRVEPLAALGDSLCLGRRFVAASGNTPGSRFDVGPYEIESLVVNTVDTTGRLTSSEIFASDHCGDAIVRLYERHAELLPEGPARVRAAATARAVATFSRSATDPERFAAALAPEIVAVDHRTVGFGELCGRDVVVAAVRALLELSEDVTWRHDELLALSEQAILSRVTQVGRSRASGGEWERPVCTLRVHGADGLIARWEIFEAEQEAAALARYDALVDGADRTPAPALSAAPFANGVGPFLERYAATWATRDWPSQADLYAQNCRFDDRRPLLQMQLPREANLEQLRVLFEVPNGRWTFTPIATRGEPLMLARLFFEGEVAGGGGALEIAHLGVLEVDGSGRMTAVVLFEPADLDAAYAELDACFAAGGAAACARAWAAPRAFAAAWNARDFDALIAIVTPDYVGQDHRRLLWGSMLSDPAVWIRSLRLMVEMAPDFRCRIDRVVGLAECGALVEAVEMGTRDGGAFETRYLWVTAVDAEGRMSRFDLYDLDQIDQARARFAELAAPPTVNRYGNAATRAAERIIACWRARDWQGLAQMLPAGLQFQDRRRIALLEGDREQYIKWLRVTGEMTSTDIEVELLGTRGDRLALQRRRVQLAGGDVGPSEMANVTVVATDAGGDPVAVVHFDEDALAAAYAELDERWWAGEGTAHPRVVAYQTAFARALASCDWVALAALHTPTLVAHDHRLVGWDVLRGPSEYVGALQAMVDLAPDALGRADHLRTSERGLLAEVVWVGTREGGAFESPFIWVVELDAEGRAQRLDFYDPHHLDAAWARFDEIRAIARPIASGPPAAIVTPRAVAAMVERCWAAFDAGLYADDWEPMRRLCAPGMIFEDRQRRALLSGDTELMIASVREGAKIGARPEQQLMGIAGDRVIVGRTIWSGGPPAGRFEIEVLSVTEADETGRITAMILFDPEDARAAQREAWARWAAIEPDVAPWVDLVGALVDGFNAHDREGSRAVFAEDIVVEDHRRTGFGRIAGADAYIEAITVLWELAPDHHMELGWFWPAVERHGVVTTLRRFGTLADGGAFESDYLWLCIAPGGRITRVEMFELEDLDKAVARLAELRPDPLRIPPNAATRWIDRWLACTATRDWKGLDRLYAPTATFDDRRRLVRLSGDRATAIANARVIMEAGTVRLGRTLIATAGDRLALERWSWRGGEPGADFAVDQLGVTEVDANGLGIATVGFDPDDRAAASAELFERYAASGADGASPVALDVIRAWNAHDLERLRDLLPADFYLDDRRRTGVGRLDGAAAYLASLAALWELSRDLRLETLYFIATKPDGRLYVCRWFGTNAEGGELDAIYVCLGLARGDRPVGLEIFELEDLAAAQARFEELWPGGA